MGNISCKCGNWFSDKNPEQEFHLLSQSKYEQVVEEFLSLDSNNETDAEKAWLVLSEEMGNTTTTFECPFCKRLIVFWNGSREKGKFYKPED